MRTLIATCAIVLLWPTSAVAGVDVSPDKLDPVVKLRAEKKSPIRSTPQKPRIGQSKVRAVRTKVQTCQVLETGGATCGTEGDTGGLARPAADTLTAGDIREAVREVEMPALRVQVQPGERTLVNVPTIFHTTPQTLRRTVDLLGHAVEVRATPVRYTWHGGDGSQRTTTSPGRPYPAKDVTHRYVEPADVVRPRVDTTYSVRYRVDGGAWQGLGETLSAVGPSARLRVDEAAPVLVRP